MLCCRKRWIYKLQMNSHFCLCRDDWFKNFTHGSIVCLQVLYGVGKRGGRRVGEEVREGREG